MTRGRLIRLNNLFEQKKETNKKKKRKLFVRKLNY